MHLLLVQRVLGVLLSFFSVMLLVPVPVGLLYGEGNLHPFVIAFVITLGVGLALWLPVRKVTGDLRLRDAFLSAVLFWTVLSAFGALPFYLAENLDISFSGAVFESVSGLTTTGATALQGIDTLPHSILFYRQFLQWLGGLGIIVLAIAVLPMLGVGGMQLYRAETPGPIKDAKLTPRINETAKYLWYVYLLLTALCAVSYYVAGMSAFDAICHSFSTVAIGGFSTHDASMGYFDSVAINAVAVVFMLVAAANFALHFMALRSRTLKVYRRDSEFKVYLSLMGMILAITVVYLMVQGFDHNEALRHGIFQAVSIATTSGFTTTDYSVWPGFLPVLLISASFIGGCAGSTGGGIKVVRFWLLVKQGLREMVCLVHPKAEVPVKINGKTIDTKVMNAVWGFFSAYVGVFVLMIMLLLASGVDEVTAFSAIAATLNNLGPGLGQVSSNYASLGDYDRWLLCASMLLGRLEIFTLLIVFTPVFWRK